MPCASFSKGLKEQVLYLGDFEGAGGATGRTSTVCCLQIVLITFTHLYVCCRTSSVSEFYEEASSGHPPAGAPVLMRSYEFISRKHRKRFQNKILISYRKRQALSEGMSLPCYWVPMMRIRCLIGLRKFNPKASLHARM